MYRWSNLAVVLAFGLAITGCEQAKSANPLSPSVAGPIPGVNITAPQTLDPPAGAELVQQGQPVSLIIQNATTTGERPLWLQVQLASDPSFSVLLHHADRITPGEGGRTTYRIPEALGAGYTYYWRTRALDGANTGPYSEPASFKVVEPVVFDAPVPLEPVGNITTVTPVFKLRNGRIIGSSNVVYRIEVGTAPDPASIVAVLTAAADPSGTTSIAVGTVPYATTYYWRAYATDGTSSSPYSAVVSFRTPNSPTGGGGGGTGGGGGGTGGGGTGGGGTGGGGRTPNPTSGRLLAARLRCQRRQRRGGAVSERAPQLVPGQRRDVGIHGPRGGSAAHLRHPLGLQRQAR